jgi:hypothetical protein
VCASACVRDHECAHWSSRSRQDTVTDKYIKYGEGILFRDRFVDRDCLPILAGSRAHNLALVPQSSGPGIGEWRTSWLPAKIVASTDETSSMSPHPLHVTDCNVAYFIAYSCYGNSNFILASTSLALICHFLKWRVNLLWFIPLLYVPKWIQLISVKRNAWYMIYVVMVLVIKVSNIIKRHIDNMKLLLICILLLSHSLGSIFYQYMVVFLF